MKHTLYIIILIFFYFSASSQEISVKANFPKKIELGKKYPVIITIKKSDLTSFAEYKQIFPTDFIVENNTSNSVNFSYINNLMTYSWNNLPHDSILTLKYTISTKKFNTENFNFQGVFSYIVSNKRGIVQTENIIYTLKKENKKQIAISKKAVKSDVPNELDNIMKDF